MKNTLLTILAAVLIFGGAKLLVIGAQYKYAEHRVSNNQTFAAPKDFKNSFMEGCTSTAGEINLPFCACGYDTLVASLGDAKLQAVALEYAKSNALPEAFSDAAYVCNNKLVQVEDN